MLGNDGVITTSTCNRKSKKIRLLVDETQDTSQGTSISDTRVRVLEGYCLNHLHNMWLDGMKKPSADFWNIKLQSTRS